jgi:hypothetical protein
MCSWLHICIELMICMEGIAADAQHKNMSNTSWDQHMPKLYLPLQSDCLHCNTS